LNASEVVAALAMFSIYSHMGIYFKLFFTNLSATPLPSAACRSKWISTHKRLMGH
jgi:hypothetical protein